VCISCPRTLRPFFSFDQIVNVVKASRMGVMDGSGMLVAAAVGGQVKPRLMRQESVLPFHVHTSLVCKGHGCESGRIRVLVCYNLPCVKPSLPYDDEAQLEPKLPTIMCITHFYC
jgi:hypothetical protein